MRLHRQLERHAALLRDAESHGVHLPTRRIVIADQLPTIRENDVASPRSPVHAVTVPGHPVMVATYVARDNEALGPTSSFARMEAAVAADQMVHHHQHSEADTHRPQRRQHTPHFLRLVHDQEYAARHRSPDEAQRLYHERLRQDEWTGQHRQQ